MMDCNLSVNLCGVTLKNPIIAASGTFGFGVEYEEFMDVNQLGGISLKGLTLEPRQGNPAPRISETPSGILNSVGLQNPGIDVFLKEKFPKIRSKLDTILFANIAGNTIEDYCRMAERLAPENVDFLEMNISCPNVKEGGMAFGSKPDTIYNITKEVKRYSRQPLFVKLSPNTADIGESARAAEEGGADGISLINTLVGMMIDVDARRPVLGNIIGGLSGPAIKPIALRMVWEASRAVSIPVIGMGGIVDGRDVIAFLLAGATAVSVGTANLMDPFSSLRILAEVREYLHQHEIQDIVDLIGELQL